MCKESDNINRNSFWHKNKDRKDHCKSIPTIAWDKICRPKIEEDPGIRKRKTATRKTENTNATILAKQNCFSHNQIAYGYS